MNSLAPKTYELARERFKPMKKSNLARRSNLDEKPLSRSGIARKRLSSAIPYATNSLKARKKGKRKRLQSMKALKKLVWKHFSIFIRTNEADSDGFVICVTCGAAYLWNSGQVHAGHWIHGRLDFDERNIHPQCKNDNYFTNTRVNTAYSCFMAKTYGAEVMDELRLLSNTKGNRYSRAELDELLEKYKTLNGANSLVKEQK